MVNAIQTIIAFNQFISSKNGIRIKFWIGKCNTGATYFHPGTYMSYDQNYYVLQLKLGQLLVDEF